MTISRPIVTTYKAKPASYQVRDAFCYENRFRVLLRPATSLKNGCASYPFPGLMAVFCAVTPTGIRPGCAIAEANISLILIFRLLNPGRFSFYRNYGLA